MGRNKAHLADTAESRVVRRAGSPATGLSVSGRDGLRAAAIAICAGMAVLPLQSRATDQPVAERPIFSDGDVFEYVDRWESIACQRWEVRGRDADGALVRRCKDNFAYFSADTGALLRVVGKGGKTLVSFEPAPPAIPFPLRVGTTWHGKFAVSTSDQVVSPDLDQSCEVMAFETISIAAGSFPAFRYECKTAWSVWLLHGDTTETGWYAPAAKVVIKVVNHSEPKWSYELAHYSLK